MSISRPASEFTPDRRWALRRNIELAADLSDSSGMICAALLTDISEEGCMIRLAKGQDLVRDRLLMIKVSGLEALAAYVIWCAEGKAGVAFSEPLHPATVQNLVMKSHYARISRHMALKAGDLERLPALPPFPFGE
ncbi:MAG TPA: PilZ domain-containing protein [Erythrobacter sp.]